MEINNTDVDVLIIFIIKVIKIKFINLVFLYSYINIFQLYFAQKNYSDFFFLSLQSLFMYLYILKIQLNKSKSLCLEKRQF